MLEKLYLKINHIWYVFSLTVASSFSKYEAGVCVCVCVCVCVHAKSLSVMSNSVTEKEKVT